MTTKASLADLSRRLAHDFRDPALLTRALTHGSAEPGLSADDYQRLEFLGDRVLGLLIAEMLFTRFPDAPEGELAVRLNAQVRRAAVAEVARSVGLGEHLRLGAGEAQAGGRQKDAILADACEAVIAALYLDGGLDAARQMVRAEWGARIEAEEAVARDAKTRLQEWSQGAGHGLPDYVERTREGPPHAPRFTIEVRVAGHAPALGEGRSKREAEQAAAEAFLARERLGADA